MKDFVYVNSKQLLKAAELLQGAEPSICNGDVEERPGYIKESRGSGSSSIMVFDVGIFPQTRYLIDRQGRLLVDESTPTP